MQAEELMSVVSQWLTATEALSALGAELLLIDSAEAGNPRVAAALEAVSSAGLGGLPDLPPPQREMIVGLIRMGLQHAVELVEDPTRAPGWTYEHPAVLNGWGRGSMAVPAALAGRVPELTDVRRLLDVGTGVGWLAIAAAAVWPAAEIIGIDIWPPALEAAAANVKDAGLEHRIALRAQDVTELDDEDAYDCIWLPTFFLDEAALTEALPRAARALAPSGWLVLGRFASPQETLAGATMRLRLIRGGGEDYTATELLERLHRVGLRSPRVIPPEGPTPIEYVIGRRP